MKSIYSKLIFGFFITIVASFSVAGFVSLRLNDQQIESTVEEDLITTNDYVSKVISNINIENRDDIIDLYAKSSEMAITCYSNSEGYVAYGNKKYNNLDMWWLIYGQDCLGMAVGMFHISI